MKIITDTNIHLAVILNEPERSTIIDLTSESELIAPEVLPFEIGNALTSLFRRGLLDKQRVLQAWEYSQLIPVDLRTVDFVHALEIATRFHIYAYDAYFLACALSLRLPLMTMDKKMLAVAKELAIPVVEVS
ncbi:MAG TPA: PIN domain-containing protein [Anaerolineae bacterium]|nr:PIN domain-containing protein [Anaerolineae bacterium]